MNYVEYFKLNPGINLTVVKTIMVIWIILAIVAIVIKTIECLNPFNGNFCSSVALIIFCITLIIGFSIVYYMYNNLTNNISVQVTEQKILIDTLPNQVMNMDSYTFLNKENNKEINTTKTDTTKYIKDNAKEKYIIVDKITYSMEHSWKYDSKHVDEINNQINYILKEVHY